MSNSVRPHRRQPTRLPRPWDSPVKNIGAGCHFLLQCMKVKSESEVAQSCPTLRDPMDCSPPGSSIHGICQARVLEWGAIAFSKVSTLHSQFVPPSPSPTIPTSLFSVSASLFLPCKFCCFESTVLDSQRKPGTGLPGSSRSATGQVPLTSPSLCWRQTNRLNGALP